MKPLISVIIPVYNEQGYIHKCIKSIQNQSYNNIEIIIINDGSADKSLKIIREFQKKDSRIIIINQNNMGVSNARNNGLKKAKGEYIVFLDGDDYVEHDYIETLYNNISSNNSDVSICKFITNNVKYKDTNKNEVFNSKTALINMLTANKIDSTICCKMIKSKYAKSNNFKKI